jgi:hypothetical protein
MVGFSAAKQGSCTERFMTDESKAAYDGTAAPAEGVHDVSKEHDDE